MKNRIRNIYKRMKSFLQWSNFLQDLLEKTVLNEEKQIETCLKCLLRNQSEFLSYFMHQSIKKSDFKSLVEILTAWPPECVAQAKEKYREGEP